MNLSVTIGLVFCFLVGGNLNAEQVVARKIHIIATKNFRYDKAALVSPGEGTREMISVSKHKTHKGVSFLSGKSIGVEVGKTSFKLIAPESKDLALVLKSFNSEKNKEGVQGYFVPLDRASFPLGARCFVNLSSYQMEGEWGLVPFTKGSEVNSVINIQPNSFKIVKGPNPDAKQLDSQPFYIDFIESGVRKHKVSSRFFFQKQGRVIQLFSNSASGKAPQLTTFVF